MNAISSRLAPSCPAGAGLLLTLALTSTASAQLAAQTASAPQKDDDLQLAGLPPFLLPVPGGPVEMGLSAEELLTIVAQAVSPIRPEHATKQPPDKIRRALKNSVSELGKRGEAVPTFLLGKWKVLNREYEPYVRKMLAAGQDVKPPFHWWRFGRKDDYDQQLENVRREFPKEELGPISYWERHGTKLPFALKDGNDKPIGDLPVTYVSYRDALRFAGYFGMRLATEEEWTRAARGNGTHRWLWGTSQLGDKLTEDALKELRLVSMRDLVLRPPGAVQASTGPFGHLDMTGQLWELTSTLGYRPVAGQEAFASELKKLQKEKLAEALPSAELPLWRDDRVVIKGGSYMSGTDPIQLHIDARAPVQTNDVLEGVGFRLAKSLRPGADMLFSLLRAGFSRDAFAIDQNVNLEGQVGAERYEIGADDFPTAYRAVSFAPCNWLTKDKASDLARMQEASLNNPIVIGVLASTEPLLEPKLPSGAYVVRYRHEGMSKELKDAIKIGHREVQAELKAKKDGPPKEEKPDAGKDKKDDKDAKNGEAKKEPEKRAMTWRDVLARFGLTPADLEPKDAVESLNFVRIDGIQVPTDTGCLLFVGADGKVIALTKAPAQGPAAAPFAPQIALEATAQNKLLAKLRVGVPVQMQNLKKVAEFELSVTADTAAPTAAAPWRLPQ
jgi:formylglycine-generating enzyme required for sulfatase activity